MKTRNHKPFFSIITCTLDSEKYVLRNIRSVYEQSFENYEQIFIDGYSKDKTTKIIGRYINRNRGKICLYKQKPKGISAAFNLAIEKSKGEYLVFLNSDDWFHGKRVLSSVFSFLKRNNYPDWIYGKIQVVNENGAKFGTFPERKIFQISSPLLLKFLNFIPHQAVFMNKNIFKRFGMFDEKLVSSMDYDLYLRVINKTKCIFFNRVVSNFFVHKGSKTSSVGNKQSSRMYMERVQSRYLPAPVLLFARFLNILVERYNRIYKIQ